MEEPAHIQQLKQSIRTEAEAGRRAKADKDEASRIICRKLADLPEFAAATTVMGYLHHGSEVRTRELLLTELSTDKRIVVPYCVGDRLGLFLLEDMDELVPGTFGILEPRAELRTAAEKRVDAGQLDLVIVPGVAFDRRRARLGHGKGYYDKLLAGVRHDTLLVGLAFECQMFPEIPAMPHDVAMDRVITEKMIYRRGNTNS